MGVFTQEEHPQVKLIVTLRCPVARAFSHYIMTTDPEGTPKQLRNRGRANINGASFEEVIEKELAALEAAGINAGSTVQDFDKAVCSKLPKHGGHSFIARGFYALQLEMWLKAYPRENFLILSLEQDLNPAKLQATCQQAFTHIGVPPQHQVQDSSHKVRALGCLYLSLPHLVFFARGRTTRDAG